MRTCFIGHRNIFLNTEIKNRIFESIKNEILNGNKFFTMGTHGRFDTISLEICRTLRKTYKDIDIEVVFTNLNFLNKTNNFSTAELYRDVKTCIYDIEEVYYKKRIIVTNQKMIDNCDTLICYVNEKQRTSGAKIAMRYAQKKGLNIINLFKEEDLIIFN